MCFTGKCTFENYGGGCTVKNHHTFLKEIGVSACYIGGMPDDMESAKYIEENKEKFEKLAKLAYDKNLIQRWK